MARRSNFTAPAAPALTGQKCYGYSSALVSSVACSASVTLASGDVLIGYSTFGDVSGNNRVISSVVCATGGTATVSFTADSGTAAHDIADVQANEMFHGVVSAGGTCTPQVNWSSSNYYQGVDVVVFSGLTGNLDVTTGQYNAGSTATNGNGSGSMTTTVSGELVVSGFWSTSGVSTTLTPGTTSLSFASADAHSSEGAEGIEYAVQSTAGSGTQGNWTTGTSGANCVGAEALN